MLNLKKIIKLVLIAAFICVMGGSDAWAVVDKTSGAAATIEAIKQGNGIDSSLRGCNPSCQKGETCIEIQGGWKCQPTPEVKIPAGAGSNGKVDQAAVTGCSGNLGLFSGLVDAGKEIFEGLRDLIYVVAGFGIIGVAVGGFFGNMNWKWLGAIIISLVIIATTGELITAITGCAQYTSGVITDTLK